MSIRIPAVRCIGATVVRARHQALVARPLAFTRPLSTTTPRLGDNSVSYEDLKKYTKQPSAVSSVPSCANRSGGAKSEPRSSSRSDPPLTRRTSLSLTRGSPTRLHPTPFLRPSTSRFPVWQRLSPPTSTRAPSRRYVVDDWMCTNMAGVGGWSNHLEPVVSYPPFTLSLRNVSIHLLDRTALTPSQNFSFPKPSNDQKLIFLDRSGKNAPKAVDIVKKLGYPNARGVSGGTREWNEKQKQEKK